MSQPTDWIYIGASATCEVHIQASNIAPIHARCSRESARRLQLEDLGSAAGTTVNGSARITRRHIEMSDMVYFAGHPLPASVLFEKLSHPTTDKPSGAHAVVAPAVPISPDVPTKAYLAPVPAASVSAAPSAEPASRLTLAVGVTVVGRDPDTKNNQRVAIADPILSRNHAGFLRTPRGEYYVWDLGSTFGTFVNTDRIGSRRTRILPGQTVRLASLRFRVDDVGPTVIATAGERAAGLSVMNVSHEVRTLFSRYLNLTEVSFRIAPGTMLAVMGPSGAGKTTLLRLLAGHTPPRGGRVLYNRTDLYRQFDQLKTSLGYVPQDDILHPQLTVRQTLHFAARLRLPSDYSYKEIACRVNEIMTRLGIAMQADVRVGSVLQHGISGGQRKRTSLAVELLPDPAVLLLDEPTSGLSSADAERVARSLRELANSGKTVIATIHQPSMDVYGLFDRVAVIDNDSVRGSSTGIQPGRMIFFGPASAAPEYFQQCDPSGSSHTRKGAEAILSALDGNSERTTVDWAGLFAASPLHRQYAAMPVESVATPPVAAARATRTLPSARHQFVTLLQRMWAIKVAEPWPLCQMLLIQPLLVAFGIVIASGSLHTFARYDDPTYVKDFLRIGKTLFFGIFTAIWFGCNNTAREIVGERAIYLRERMVGLHLGAYLSSKVVFYAGVCLVQCCFLALVEEMGAGLQANVLALMALYWLAAVSGLSIGLVISALAGGGETAIQMVPIALLPMILFGGGVTRLAEMQSGFARQVAVVIPARWAFEGSLVSENANRPMLVTVVAPGVSQPIAITTIPERFTLVHHYFEESPHDDRRTLVCVLQLLIFSAVLCGGAGLILRVQDPV